MNRRPFPRCVTWCGTSTATTRVNRPMTGKPYHASHRALPPHDLYAILVPAESPFLRKVPVPSDHKSTNHLTTNHLEKPATIRANAAGWQRLDHCRNQLYKARRETTIGTVEVTAGFLLTRRSNAEDLCKNTRKKSRHCINSLGDGYCDECRLNPDSRSVSEYRYLDA
jgi:hypothetical protein